MLPHLLHRLPLALSPTGTASFSQALVLLERNARAICHSRELAPVVAAILESRGASGRGLYDSHVGFKLEGSFWALWILCASSFGEDWSLV